MERTIIINIDVSGAFVYINGKYVGKTPLKLKFKGRVDLKIRIELEGYEKKEINVQLTKREDTLLNINLKKLDIENQTDNFERNI